MNKNPCVLITNNPLVVEKYENKERIRVDYEENRSYLEVLLIVRNHIHEGWNLLTHPQAGNIKADQSPYKTIIVSEKLEVQPMSQSLEQIESAIGAYHKFVNGAKKKSYTQQILEDYQLVDLAVAESAIPGILSNPYIG